MKKILYTAFVLLLFQTGFFAQKISLKEHNKYWYYRHRLLEEFVITGEAPSSCTPSGLSIPALNAEYWCGNNTKLNLNWTDNPVRGLGYYIGVLATELKLLYLYGQPYTNTQQELYYAMKAYERLDYNCECKFPFPLIESPGMTNGLFCRDDVPRDFMANSGGHADFRIANNYADSISSIYKKYQMNVEDSGKSALEETYYPSGEELSGLLTGFALIVIALADCPASVVIYNNYRFIDNAILNTQRFMDYVRADGWEGRLTNDLVYKFGADLLSEMNAYGWAKAADFICDPNRTYAVSLTINPDRHYGADFPYITPLDEIFYGLLGLPFNGINIISKLCDGTLSHDMLMDYQKFCWMLRGDPDSHFLGVQNIGQHLNDFILYGTDVPIFLPEILNVSCDYQVNKYICHKRGNIQYAISPYAFAAIGNSWKDVYNNDNDITFESLVSYTTEDHWEYYPLLNLYLHNKVKDANILRRNMVNYLITAPCQGPLYLPLYSPVDSGVPGWRSGFRWNDSSPNGWDADSCQRAHGRKFPGLDYMLAYNLLWLECYQKGNLSDYFEPTVYENVRDHNYTYYSGSLADTYFKYGEVLYSPPPGISVKFNTKNTNFVGESITINGDVEFSAGYTFNLVTYPKLTHCNLLNYFGP